MAEHTSITESRLWMKTVIDVIHDDIQNRSDSLTSSSHESARVGSSRHGSTSSSSARKEKDAQGLKRIENFIADMADVALASLTIEESTATTDAKRRTAAKLDEFDEVFEGAEKSKSS